MSYPILDDESERLAALEAFGILGTAPEHEFDRIVEIASHVFDVPIALVSLVDRDRQFFKANGGLPVCETSRDVSFCTYAMLGDEVMVVPDATQDSRFVSNALVTGEPFIRFYAGAPLISASGHRLGSLCLIDHQPRPGLSDQERLLLVNLASLVMDRMELRRLELANSASRSQFQNIAMTSPDGIICANGHNIITSWNSAAARMFGYSAEDAVGRSLDMIVPPELRAQHGRGLARVAAGGTERIIGTSQNLMACRRDGSEFPIELSLSRWVENGEPKFGAILRDVTARKQAEEQLRYSAEHDSLTGLLNRDSLHKAIAKASDAGLSMTLLLLDLDGFKDVNDTLGHAVGDQVLQVVAQRLSGIIGKDDLLGRLGGDEFVVFSAGWGDPLLAASLGEQLISAIEAPIELDEQPIYIGASIGIATSCDDGGDASTLLGDADLALYQAKADGRHRVRIFTPGLRAAMTTRSSVSSGLRKAWEEEEFELYYQPQVRLSDNSLSGAEALIRWNRPEHGVVAPGAFLPVLESGLLCVPVGEWVLRTACAQAAAWRKMGLADFRIGVNLFAAQFRTNDLAETVERALSDHDLPAEALELEVTENTILRNERSIAKTLHHLKSIGVGIAFDDFGTGFASLSMLKDYPVTRLKIDRSFISGIGGDAKGQAIVEAVIRLAAGLDLDVIAEGIEMADEADYLRGISCPEAQGYMFDRPMTAAQFENAFGSARSYRQSA